ncbi:hypothetical protein PRIPAC_91996 [Pristionchus pacificus]|uniref:Uncharacterized protein n=1 Tax=Pristionchus pacificus TaxID=54126 RepID=A0A2A6BPS1_PRIPA|nr:hypothetical protein PRIPAC_91996 [Pristionchus pacificus]|eukprot:PDM67919.1 hypothetical protein PRIPAC_45963 [Pristionchus pacificus]
MITGMLRHLSILLLLAPSLLSQLQCPGGASFFDFETCDPTKRSQCPAGFACRRGSSVNDATAVVNLVQRGWFDTLCGSSNAAYTNTRDEIITLTFPDFTTALVNTVQLSNPLQPGGFIHGITLVDPLSSPWAVFASINIVWPGGQVVDLTAARKGNGLFFSHIANATVPTKNSYRSQYVVLLYQTMAALPITFQNEVANCSDAACVFTRLSPSQGGSPVVGSFFYLTTARPLFAVGPVVNSSPSASILSIPIAFLLAKCLF